MTYFSIKNLAEVELTSSELEKASNDLILYSKYTGESLVLMSDGSAPNRLFVPVSYLPPPITVEDAGWEPKAFTFTGTLRSEQEGLVDGYLNHLHAGNIGGIIKAPTGSGKTVVALKLIAELGYKTLIVVPTTYLMGQWEERIKQFMDGMNNRIGICRQQICDYRDKDIVIGMIHSLSKIERYPEDFYKQFGLVIVDEVHKLSAPTFSQSVPQFWSKYRLGLSATPRRKDGFENVFKYHIGAICSPGNLDAIRPDVYIIKYHNNLSNHTGCVYGGNLSLGRYYNKVSKLEHRNYVISKIISTLKNNGYEVLVLSDRLLQLDNLRSLLLKEGIRDIGVFTGTKKVGLDKPVILATYGSAGLGADIPRLTAVVFATPRVDVEQSMGRVLRETKDKPQVVVDIIDTASSIMEQWGYARLRFYKKACNRISMKEVRC